MEVILDRKYKKANYTIGKLYLNITDSIKLFK